MPRHHQRTRLPYTAEQMFDLVVDIEKYPAFLPWCVGLRIRSREKLGEAELMTADLAIGFKTFRETFTSRVKIDRKARRVDVEYLDGPFRYLHNVWVFEPHDDDSCIVDFSIDFEFRNRVLKLAMNHVFHRAVQHMVGSFEKRAEQLYKTPPTRK